MISKFPKSIKGKAGTVFLIFNVLIAICNMIIYFYMAAGYCDNQILTLPITSILFALLNLFLLIKQVAWNSTSQFVTLGLSLALCVASIAGVVICSQFIFCKLILCAKGVDTIYMLDQSPLTRNSKYCGTINENQEETYLRGYFQADYRHSMVIEGAWPLAFGIIQIILCFFQTILTFLGLYKCACPPTKEVKGLEMYD